MLMTRKTRRAVLLGVALLLVAGNVWWFSREEPSAQQAFELATTGADRPVPSGEVRSLPRFDAGSREWRVAGRAANDLRSRLETLGVDAGGSAASGQFLTVALPATATSEDMRRMLLSLVKQDICEVAVVQEGDPEVNGGGYRAAIHNILAVRSDDGSRLACITRD